MIGSLSLQQLQMFRVKYLLFTVALGMVACAPNETEEAPFTTDMLLGHWDLVSAKSGGNPTDRLEGIYFEFNADGKVTHNLMGAQTAYPFELDGDMIKQSDEQMPLEYQILSLTDSLLVFTMKIRETPFELRLKPANSGMEQ